MFQWGYARCLCVKVPSLIHMHLGLNCLVGVVQAAPFIYINLNFLPPLFFESVAGGHLFRVLFGVARTFSDFFVV